MFKKFKEIGVVVKGIWKNFFDFLIFSYEGLYFFEVLLLIYIEYIKDYLVVVLVKKEIVEYILYVYIYDSEFVFLY